MIALLFLLLLSPSSPAKQHSHCALDELRDASGVDNHAPAAFLDVERFEHLYRLNRENSISEPTVTFKTYEAARNYVQKFPALQKYGFDPQNHTHWKRVYARLEKSSFYGKFVGWEEKLSNGNFARYRYDFEPDQLDPITQKIIRTGRGGHWNIEISILNSSGRRETSKLAVQFLCSGHRCSEAEALTYLKRMNR